jgi:hypothetical protein
MLRYTSANSKKKKKNINADSKKKKKRHGIASWWESWRQCDGNTFVDAADQMINQQPGQHN